MISAWICDSGDPHHFGDHEVNSIDDVLYGDFIPLGRERVKSFQSLSSDFR